MKVFVVNGQGGSGKDLFEKLVAEETAVLTYKISIIDSVKKVAEDFGWKGSKEMRDRLFLNNLKNLFSEYNDSPYQKLKKEIEYYKYSNDFLFVDAREPSDIERLKKDFNATTVLIKRGELKKFNNMADDMVFSIDYDVVIDNNGTIEELKEKAEKFYLDYIKE